MEGIPTIIEQTPIEKAIAEISVILEGQGISVDINDIASVEEGIKRLDGLGQELNDGGDYSPLISNELRLAVAGNGSDLEENATKEEVSLDSIIEGLTQGGFAPKSSDIEDVRAAYKEAVEAGRVDGGDYLSGLPQNTEETLGL